MGMKKIYGFMMTLMLLALLPATTSTAQIKFGVKGGVNLPNVTVVDYPSSERVINNRVGFFIGPTALIDLPVRNLALDAAIMFDQRGVETKNPDLIGGRVYFTTTTQQQITIPLNARYNLTSGEKAKLFVFAGPQLSINVGKKENEVDEGVFVFDKSALSINAGIGLLLYQHLQLSANYNAVFKKNAEIWNATNVSWANPLHRSRFNAWQFSIGYYF